MSAPDAGVVYIVDDEESTRNIIVRHVTAAGYHASPFASAREFLAAARDDRPACLVLDMHLQDGTGFDVFDAMERRGDALPTIFLTGAGTIPMTVRAMKAGAVEFLTKPPDWEALRNALTSAMNRARQIRERRAEAAKIQERLDALTPREREVVPYVARGLPNKQIAAELKVVEQTVKVHRARMMQKLGVDSVAELVHLVDKARELGIEV
ncbi:MAG TPA: response regulator [Gemmatimonadaceae bacterium]|nr:response regulator [Gemmatimonadaceae bacterium]